MPEKVYCSECKWDSEDASFRYPDENNCDRIRNWLERKVDYKLNPPITNANNDCKWWEGK